MEYKIRQRADGVCEYTGNSASVLIKLYDKDEHETGWMSAEALKAALNLVGALDGSRDDMNRQIPTFHQPFCQPYPKSIPVDPLNPLGQITVTNMEVNQSLQENIKAAFPAATIPPKNQKKNRELLRQVESDCRELLDNPPPNGLGKEDSSSIGELHIREIISEYKDLFRGAENDLYLVINKYFGMPRFRFDFLIGKPIE